jgi:DNA-binding transcriptional LysR family regulator
MDLRHLRYFVAVAETGAFSRAAARLHITQPALWRQVHDLETELGVSLFERVGRRVRLTSDGEQLLGRSRDVLERAERLAEHAHALQNGELGTLRVSASPQLIQSMLAPFLAWYLRSRAGIEVHLIEEGGVRAAALVECGDADLGLALRPREDRLDGLLLFPVRVLAAVVPTHRLARRTTVDATELQDEPVLLLRHGFGTREMFDSACRLAQVRPRVVVEAGDPQTLIALAETGRGVAIVPSTVRFHGRTVRATPVLHARASLGMWGWVVWDPRRRLPAYATDFVDRLVQYSRRTHPGREFDRRAPPVARPRQ